MEQIRQGYIKQQQELSKTSTTQKFLFEFVNIDLFPFFCLPKDIQNPRSVHVYFYDYSGSFLKYTDAMGDEHLQIGVVSYVQGKEVYFKTYRLFFYCKKATLDWTEEKEPVKIIFVRSGDAFISMIQKIITMPRTGVLKMIESGMIYENIQAPWALISIYNDADILADLKNNRVLRSLDCTYFQSFRFADITDTMELTPKLREKCSLFSEDNARDIIAFIEKIKYSVDTLVINCAAGISRSGAVGLFVCRYLGLNEQAYFDENHPIPNMFILGVLNKVSGLNADYVGFWAKQVAKDARLLVVNRARNIFN